MPRYTTTQILSMCESLGLISVCTLNDLVAALRASVLKEQP